MKPIIVTEDDGSKWVDFDSYERLLQRVVQLHRTYCDVESCNLDGGDEHAAAFADVAKAVCPRCDGTGRHSWIGNHDAGKCSLCAGTGRKIIELTP